MKKIKFLCVGDVVKLSLDDFNYLMKKAYPPKVVLKAEKPRKTRKPRAKKSMSADIVSGQAVVEGFASNS